MSIEGITQPIRVDSVEEHMEILKDRFVDIQLEYADRVFSKKIPPTTEELDVSSLEKTIVNLVPSILQELKKSYKARMGDKFNEESYKLFQQKTLDDIYLLYQTDKKNWINRTKQLMKEELEKIGKFPKKEDKK